MIRIGRDENEQRGFNLHHSRNHRKTVKARHLDIEEDKIRFVRLDGADRFATVNAGFDDINVGVRLEPQLQALNREFFIIDENGTDGHAVSCSR